MRALLVLQSAPIGHHPVDIYRPIAKPKQEQEHGGTAIPWFYWIVNSVEIISGQNSQLEDAGDARSEHSAPG